MSNIERRDFSTLQPGQKLGKYEIKRLIGRGGMAEVYRALNPTLKQDVAIKVLYLHVMESPDAAARFEREAQSIAALVHPNILRVYDFETAGGLSYMVMELVEGPTLRELLRSYPAGMPQEQARTLFEQVAEALAFAHARGVVHRDVKPANVMIAGQGRPVLTDFGLALIQGGERLTQTGTGAGTPAYMSPEQATGGAITPASDVYALGIMLYEMVTGRVPFEGDSFPQLILKHLHEVPTTPRTVLPTLDPALDYVIVRALSKAPADRFADAGAMVRALRGEPEPNLENDATVIPGVPYQSKILSGSESKRAGTGGPNRTAPLDAPRTTMIDTNPSRLTRSVQTIQRNPVLAAGGLIALVLGVIGVALVAVIGSAGNRPTGTPGPTLPPVPEGMIYIPGGTFTMGTAQGDEIETPPHAVTVSPFFIDKTEVANGNYLTFMINAPRPLPLPWPKVDRGNWIIEASKGYVIGSPTNKHAYDGAEKIPISGTFKVDVNPDTDKGVVTGTFEAEIRLRDSNPPEKGVWSFKHDLFTGNKGFYQGGVGEHILMHGDTGNEGPIFPNMDGIVTTWGTGALNKDGKEITAEANFHVMYTDGIRDAEGRILKSTTDCCYSPTDPSRGYVNPAPKQLVILISTVDVYASESSGGATPPLYLELHLEEPTVVRQPNGGAATFVAGTADQPVTGVTWNDAAAYCEYRKARLPKEAEWEFAARGTDGRLFPWGESAKIDGDIPANWTSGGAVKAGSYPKGASPFGVLDMAGNAWEWVHDWYDAEYYGNSTAAVDPLGSALGSRRLLRGGGFTQRDAAGGAEYRATFRLPFDPAKAELSFGFRCVRDVL